MLTQANRTGRLTTPLGKDVLCLVEVNGSEGLSEIFEYNILAASEDPDIDLDSIIGQGACIEIDSGPLGKRYFHGLVVEAQWERIQFDLYYYRLTLRPWMWLLGRTSDCRIFHDMTVLDIIRDTFQRHGFSDFRLATTYSYPSLHYTVQYRETDLNFVRRLMELHGIYFFFEHSADSHVLVLGDSLSSHLPAPGAETVVFNPIMHDRHKAREPILYGWSLKRRLRSGKVQINDFNHTTPNAAMLADKQANEAYTHANLEQFDYPGPYTQQGDGTFYARVRLEEEQSHDKRRVARGAAVALYAGAKTSLLKYPRAAENDDYLTVRIDFRFGPQSYRTNDPDEEASYEADYEFQKLTIPYRAPFVTEKPLIHSLQTAFVVGAEGEEIDCDDHGRILVHFHWDRHGDRSCRVRVSQVWGSQQWGGQVIPRVGMEVMVAYLEGDPDRPIVVGSVPNPQTNKVPYTLPDKKTKMVWRSNTHKGSGYNELTFEDENGQQNLFMHAEKDHTQKTRNNHTHRVDQNSVQSIGANHSMQIANNMSHQIGGGLSQIIGLPPTSSDAVDAATASTLTGDSGAGMASGAASLAQSVAGMVGPGILNQLITLMHNTVTGVAKTEEIGVSSVLSVGQTFDTNVGKEYTISVGDRFTVQVGGGTDKDGNKTEPKSTLVMTKDGDILLKGVKVYVEGEAHVQVLSSMIDHN